MFNHQAYLIKTLTNTHMGAFDSTDNLIDNMIQSENYSFMPSRNKKVPLPVIHASSLKGAIKDHFALFKSNENKQPKGSNCVKPLTFDLLFGQKDLFTRLSDIDTSAAIQKELESNPIKTLRKFRPKQGLLKFYKAHLLTIPMPCTTNIFYHATSPGIAINFLNTLNQFLQKNDKINQLIQKFKAWQKELNDQSKDFIVFTSNAPIISGNGNGLSIEPDELCHTMASRFSPNESDCFLNSLAIFKDDVLLDMYDINRSVIPRNKLSDQGVSKNLFYEEVLPKHAVLWFICGQYNVPADTTTLKDYSSDAHYIEKAFRFFENRLQSDTIQMGANASLGYGMTSISKIII